MCDVMHKSPQRRDGYYYRVGVKHMQMYIILVELCLSPAICARSRIEKLSLHLGAAIAPAAFSDTHIYAPTA